MNTLPELHFAPWIIHKHNNETVSIKIADGGAKLRTMDFKPLEELEHLEMHISRMIRQQIRIYCHVALPEPMQEYNEWTCRIRQRLPGEKSSTLTIRGDLA